MIEVRGLKKTFRDFVAIEDVSFDARPGQITGFLGPNGAGKTTTMRILATLMSATAGSARVAGFDVATQGEEVRQRLGLLTEEPGLYDRMTGREQLMYFARAYGLSKARAAERIDEVSAMLGLDPHIDRRAGTLSKGNRQKVAVARAIVHDPDVLLLDEPTAALDVVAASALEEFMAGDALRGKTVLLSTHIVEEAARLCDSIVVLAHGGVVADGTPAELGADGDLRTALLTLMGEPNRKGVA